MEKAAFHLSLPCRSISLTKHFYVDILGAKTGRSTQAWVDIDLFGNQITFTKAGDFKFDYRSYKFEDSVLPAFHFGVIVDQATWLEVFKRLQESDYEITNERTFLKDKNGEHRSFFLVDPNHYTIEFKSFADKKGIFA